MSPQAIAERAYLIWENTGRPEGQALEHWVRAEAELAAKAAAVPKPIRQGARRRRGRRKKI
jgi:Protein of unknown function (DUF2934)